MSNENNPQNYPGVGIDYIVGTAGGEVEYRTFENGGSQASLSVAVGEGYKKDGQWVDQGTTWYRVIATQDYAEDNWPYIGKGDKVRIDGGRLSAREFDRRDGSKGQSFEVRFGNVRVLESKQAASEDKPF